MIYTVGHHAHYMEAIAYHGTINKTGQTVDYPGGSVWKTREEAQAVAECNPGFAVFGVDADWEADTYHVEGNSFNSLVRDSDIVVLTTIGEIK